MRIPTIAGMGVFIFVVGFYLLPFGMDMTYAVFMHYTGGDFFLATILMYATSIGLMFIGIALASQSINLGPLNVVKSPHFIIVVLLVVVATFFVVLGRVGQ